jgi:hypothetical protein
MGHFDRVFTHQTAFTTVDKAGVVVPATLPSGCSLFIVDQYKKHTGIETARFHRSISQLSIKQVASVSAAKDELSYQVEMQRGEMAALANSRWASLYVCVFVCVCASLLKRLYHSLTLSVGLDITVNYTVYDSMYGSLPAKNALYT